MYQLFSFVILIYWFSIVIIHADLESMYRLLVINQSKQVLICSCSFSLRIIIIYQITKRHAQKQYNYLSDHSRHKTI